MLGLALLASCLYAAFAAGAIRAPEEPRVEVAVAVITTLAAAAGVWSSRLTLVVPRLALTALGLLGAFCAWSLLTLVWSVAPSDTWVEVNRVFTYTLVLALGISLGASAPRVLERTAAGLLALTLAVVLFGLAQKIIPGVHILGLDLDQTAQSARLQAPLDYWNAMALFACLGAPAGLTLAISPTAHRSVRLTGLIAVELIVVTVGFSESRGGFVALAVALAATIALSPDRLTTLVWAVVAVGAGVLDLVIALPAHALSANGVALGTRESAGLLLLVIILAVAVLSVLALGPLDALPAHLNRSRRRAARRGLGYGLAGLIVLALVAAAVSSRGLGGQISHLWDGFNNADSIANSGAGRLLSDSSANRVNWWGQALRAFSVRPLGGYGAGSFAAVNQLFRHDTVSVQDAHSVPLQWLAETGIVGFVLAAGAWVTLLRCALVAVRRAGARRVDPRALDTAVARQRLAAVALAAPALAYTVHALYDWDWDIPGLTLPVLVILGVLAGSLARTPVSGTALFRPGDSPRTRTPLLPGPVGPSVRLLVLGAITALMLLFAISAVIPEIAADHAEAAVADAARGTPTALARARQQASLASALNPLSDEGPLAASSVALASGEVELARDEFIQALRRAPVDETAWDDLVNTDLGLRRYGEAIAAAQRLLEVDPVVGRGTELALAEQVSAAELALADPAGSATALPTPGG